MSNFFLLCARHHAVAAHYLSLQFFTSHAFQNENMGIALLPSDRVLHQYGVFHLKSIFRFSLPDLGIGLCHRALLNK